MRVGAMPSTSYMNQQQSTPGPPRMRSRPQARMTPRDLLEAKSVAVGVDGTLVPKERASRGMVCGAAS